MDVINQQVSSESEPAQNVLERNFADAALEKIRAAVRGNGIKPEDVKLQKFSGEVAEFAALTSLTLRVRTIERVVGGKKGSGEKVDGPQGLRDALERDRQKILTHPDIDARIKAIVLERKDKGFGVRNEIIKLPFLTKEYVHQQPCKSCGAQGELKCQRCHGRGHETCPRCNGQSVEICSQCRGSQLVNMGNGQQTCPKCNGQGRTPCTMCNQTRKIPCPTCRMKGAIQCQSCHGNAWHSYITTADTDVLATFSFKREGLPAKIAAVMEARVKDVANYATLTVLPPRPASESEGRGENEIPMEYQVRLPYAEADIALGKQATAHAFLMGESGEIADITDFLETLIRPGTTMLQDAAQGRGNVAAKIQRAGKYRTVRQAIIASTKYSRGKAARLLAKNTPLGLNDNTIKKLVINADLAMKNITAKPRRNGVLAGAALAGALYAIYILASLRAMLTGFIANEIFHGLADAVIAGMGMMFSIFTIQFLSAGAMRRALGKLLPPGQENSVTGKAGHSGLYSALLCAALFLLICEAAIHMNGSPPEWYVMVREFKN